MNVVVCIEQRSMKEHCHCIVAYVFNTTRMLSTNREANCRDRSQPEQG